MLMYLHPELDDIFGQSNIRVALRTALHDA